MIKVICIDNFMNQAPLTINKVYDVCGIIGDYFLIKNDKGEKLCYAMRRFITLAEYRDKRIDEILNEE